MPEDRPERKLSSSAAASASPPTARVVGIVELLVVEGRALTVAEIAADLGLNRSTATAVLAELERLGWVDRLADRRYGVGPALTGLASSIGRSHFMLRAPARLAVAELSRRAQGAVAVTRIGRADMTFVYLHQSSGQVPAGITVGSRLALDPPVGAAAMSQRSPDEQQVWLSRAPVEQRAQLRTLLDHVADRGVAAFRLGGGANGQLLELLADMVTVLDEHPARATFHGRILGVLAELGGQAYDVDAPAPRDPVPISHLVAPVSDAGGYPRYELQLGLLREVTHGDLLSYMDELREVAQVLSEGSTGV